MEEKDLAKWLEHDYRPDANENSDLTEVIAAIDSFSVPKLDEDKMYRSIQDRIQASPTPRKIINLNWVSAIAASIIGILFLYTFLQPKSFNISSDIGQQLVHTLPDHSKVTLNGLSNISYKKDFLDNRSIELDGEAFFEVKKGSSFTVVTDMGTVEVLGTSFNVWTQGSSFIVECKTGSVKVSHQDSETILKPGMRSQLQKNELNTDSVDISSMASWLNGESKFTSIAFRDVITALSNQYPISISAISKDLGNQKFTGSFVHDDLNKALKMVFLPMGVTFSLNPDGQVLIEE